MDGGIALFLFFVAASFARPFLFLAVFFRFIFVFLVLFLFPFVPLL